MAIFWVLLALFCCFLFFDIDIINFALLGIWIWQNYIGCVHTNKVSSSHMAWLESPVLRKILYILCMVLEVTRFVFSPFNWSIPMGKEKYMNRLCWFKGATFSIIFWGIWGCDLIVNLPILQLFFLRVFYFVYFCSILRFGLFTL